jgi:Holliday junction resolvasome RuvABC endonuclease subunit
LNYCGIDPGMTGAVALIDDSGQLLNIQDTPILLVKASTGNRTQFLESQMALLLRNITFHGDVRTCIENVHSMPKQGVRSVFSLGLGFGIWIGITAALHLSLERTEPAVWKKCMGLRSGADKAASVVLALRLFPTADLKLKKHHGRAEALLIAEFLRRKLTGQAFPALK